MNGCNILRSFQAGLAQVSETRGVNQLRVLLLLALQLNVQQRERPAGPIRRPQPRPHQTQLDASQDATLVGRPATNPLHYPSMKSAAKPRLGTYMPRQQRQKRFQIKARDLFFRFGAITYAKSC